MKPEIFTYLDYRPYLKDSFDWLKEGAPKLSYRNFAKKGGFCSPNFLQMIIQGKRNLSSTHTLLMARAFKLNKQETEFFQNLVGYNQARSYEEKDLFYQKILRNKRYATVKTLDRSRYDFFAHWYIPVVRELLIHKDFPGESGWIADRIFPKISVAQVDGARSLLQKLEMVRLEEATGKWILTDPVISTASEALHLGIRAYHMASIQLAHDALKNFGPEERDVRSVTVGLSHGAYAELKSRLENVWKEVMDFAGSQQNVEKIYQVNMQLFPLTRERRVKDE